MASHLQKFFPVPDRDHSHDLVIPTLERSETGGIRWSAADVALSKGLVDKAIAAAAKGLSGQGCFDRRYPALGADTEYGAGDWDIRGCFKPFEACPQMPDAPNAFGGALTTCPPVGETFSTARPR